MVSRNGKSFDVRFQANLEINTSGLSPLATQASAEPASVDVSYEAPKTFLPRRLAGLQTPTMICRLVTSPALLVSLGLIQVP